MNKKILLLSASALMSASALAQIKVHDTGTKWDGRLSSLVEGHSLHRISPLGKVNTLTADSTVSVIVSATDAAQVAEYLNAEGYSAEAITSQTLTADIPARFIRTLAERDDVLFVNATRQFAPLMNLVRTDIKATRVQNGSGLDSPFTGEGVVVGVIDQGFEYNHAAFQGRVKAVWQNGELKTSNLPTSGGSSDDSYGHASHVTNIAAGGKVDGCDLYGLAYDADIVMAPSTFEDSEVLKQAKAIKEYAEEQGKPWVINMSFGGNVGPHDASTAYDQSMSELCGNGGIMVAAMGNSGGSNIHAAHTFTEDGETIYVFPKPTGDNSSTKVAYAELWSDSADGTNHLTIDPVLVITAGSQYRETEVTAAQMRSAGFTYSTGIDAYNNKQYVSLLGYVTNLIRVVGTSSSAQLMLRVKGNAGDSFNAWTDDTSYSQEFSTLSSLNAVAGDDQYLVGEGAASIGKAIAVASYNNTISFKSYNTGQTASYTSIGVKGGISTFSSPGPQLNDLPKPAIIAPGGCVSSAFSKYSSGFSTTLSEITDVVQLSGSSSKYYYGVMSGTSMASPVVTGTIALWLQANPDLSYEDVIEVFKQTARRDTYVGQLEDGEEYKWDNRSGYGKIDAYEGIKAVLDMKTGISNVNTSAPVTLQKGDEEWKVLFNNDESFANIRLYNTSGQLVSSQHLSDLKCGQEQVVSLSSLQPGVYLFNVETSASSLTRKLIVK